MTEGGGVAELRDMAALVRGVSDDVVRLGAAEEQLRGAAEMAVDVGAVIPVEAALTAGVEDASAADVRALASVLGADPTAGDKGKWLVDKAEEGGRSGVILEGLNTEEACAAGMLLSITVDFVREAVARDGVLVIGVVVCESGVEPGGVWRTESRKEKVWETGLRLSPVISAKLPLTSPATLLLPWRMFGSGLLVETFSPFDFFLSLSDKGKPSMHIGSYDRGLESLVRLA